MYICAHGLVFIFIWLFVVVDSKLNFDDEDLVKRKVNLKIKIIFQAVGHEGRIHNEELQGLLRVSIPSLGSDAGVECQVGRLLQRGDAQ